MSEVGDERPEGREPHLPPVRIPSRMLVPSAFWVWISLCISLYTVGCLPTSLASTHWMPVDSSPFQSPQQKHSQTLPTVLQMRTAGFVPTLWLLAPPRCAFCLYHSSSAGFLPTSPAAPSFRLRKLLLWLGHHPTESPPHLVDFPTTPLLPYYS